MTNTDTSSQKKKITYIQNSREAFSERVRVKPAEGLLFRLFLHWWKCRPHKAHAHCLPSGPAQHSSHICTWNSGSSASILSFICALFTLCGHIFSKRKKKDPDQSLVWQWCPIMRKYVDFPPLDALLMVNWKTFFTEHCKCYDKRNYTILKHFGAIIKFE